MPASKHTTSTTISSTSTTMAGADGATLHVVDLDRDSIDDLIPLGLALHHFGDAMLELRGPTAELHHALTVLTRQLRRALDDHHGLDDLDHLRDVGDSTHHAVDAPGGDGAGDDRGALDVVRSLVTDPARIATADGVVAAEFCGEAWDDIARQAEDRAVAAIEGAGTYGTTPILRLAATRAAQTRLPWWGTPEWAALVEQAVAQQSVPEELRVTLLRAPEHVGIDLLARVLHGNERQPV